MGMINMRFFYSSLLAISMFCMAAYGQEEEPKQWYDNLKATGFVQSNDDKNRESIILNDKIIWSDKLYLIDKNSGAIIDFETATFEQVSNLDMYVFKLEDVTNDGASVRFRGKIYTSQLEHEEDNLVLFFKRRR